MAARCEIHESGVTTREYLWANFTQIDPETGEPLPSPAQTDNPSTSPAPPPSAGPIPTNGGTSSPGTTQTPTASSGDGAGASTELPIAGVLLVAIAAAAIIAIGVWRRPNRR